METTPKPKAAPRAKPASKAEALWKRPCPECAAELDATLMPEDGMPGVCPVCAAIFIAQTGKPPRSPYTQEWHDFFCRPGFDYLWDVRQHVLDAMPTKPRGARATAARIPA